MKKYLLIQGNDDGVSLCWPGEHLVSSIPELMDEYGVTEFVTDPHLNGGVVYWPPECAMLLEVKILTAKPKEVVKTWELVEAD